MGSYDHCWLFIRRLLQRSILPFPVASARAIVPQLLLGRNTIRARSYTFPKRLTDFTYCHSRSASLSSFPRRVCTVPNLHVRPLFTAPKQRRTELFSLSASDDVGHIFGVDLRNPVKIVSAAPCLVCSCHAARWYNNYRYKHLYRFSLLSGGYKFGRDKLEKLTR